MMMFMDGQLLVLDSCWKLQKTLLLIWKEVEKSYWKWIVEQIHWALNLEGIQRVFWMWQLGLYSRILICIKLEILLKFKYWVKQIGKRKKLCKIIRLTQTVFYPLKFLSPLPINFYFLITKENHTCAGSCRAKKDFFNLGRRSREHVIDGNTEFKTKQSIFPLWNIYCVYAF